MRVLLDTHAFLWFLLADSKLSVRGQSVIAAAANQVYVSPASYWEIAIKLSTKKLALDQPYSPFIEDEIRANRFSILAIEPKHTAILTVLPYHHRDPFDRMLAAQSLVENLPLVSCDPQFDAYGVRRIW